MTSRDHSKHPHTGQIAVFSAANASAPNTFRCPKCERRFATKANMARHDKVQHGEKTFKYRCPRSPARHFSKRAQLREHYTQEHPELDSDEVDDVELTEVPKQEQPLKRQTSTFDEEEESHEVKRKKEESSEETSPGTSGDTSGKSPMTQRRLGKLAPGSKLVHIKETIKTTTTIERLYTFKP